MVSLVDENNVGIDREEIGIGPLLAGRERLRHRCTHDLFWFSKHVLEYEDLTASIHAPLCRIIESINPIICQLRDGKVRSGGGWGGGESVTTPTQNPTTFHNLSLQSSNLGKLSPYVQLGDNNLTRLFLLFRGAFKSTIITIAHTIQLMLIWPDIRILIASHKKEGGSQKFLAAIKHHFIRNKKLRALFPEYCPQPNSVGMIEWGTQDAVTLPNRSDTAAFPEETIEIASSTSNVTGRHYNYIKVDDIVTVDSVTNEIMLQKTEEFNALLKFLFDNPEQGITDYIGTTYHFADLYSILRASKDITRVILPCWDEAEQPTIPERFTHDGLQRLKDDPMMTSFQFSAQYMLNPIPEEDQTFRPEWWRRAGFYYDKEPENLRVAVFVDPASKQRKESDYTALISIGMDTNGEYYLLDIIRDKLTVEGRAKLVIDTLIKRGIHKVHYETIGFQNTDLKTIKELGVRRDWHVTVEEIKASRQSKEDRIRGLQGIYEGGHIHWPKEYSYHSLYHQKTLDMVDILKRELWMFPKVKFFDLSDCHSFMLRSNLYKPTEKREAPKDDKFEWWRQLAINSKKKEFRPFNKKAEGGIPSFPGCP